MTENRPDGRFPTTRWSRVVAAAGADRPEARAALAELCAAYWFPVYALIRRKGHDPDAALDLAQDYFARLLEKPVLAAADRRKGRFRAFLLTDCVHFLANAHDRAARLKRGGGQTFVPINAGAAEGRYGAEPAHHLTAERLFERTWALTLLATVFEALRREFESEGKGAAFDELKVALEGGPTAVRYAEIAVRLGTSEGAVKVAVHRLRKRYRALLREQIAATVDDPAEVDDEIRALFDALG
jgi:DNA-directed RNA polymerase specialized sigma24 family protein